VQRECRHTWLVGKYENLTLLFGWFLSCESAKIIGTYVKCMWSNAGGLTISRNCVEFSGWKRQRIAQAGEDWRRLSSKSGQVMADNNDAELLSFTHPPSYHPCIRSIIDSPDELKSLERTVAVAALLMNGIANMTPINIVVIKPFSCAQQAMGNSYFCFHCDQYCI